MPWSHLQSGGACAAFASSLAAGRCSQWAARQSKGQPAQPECETGRVARHARHVAGNTPGWLPCLPVHQVVHAVVCHITQQHAAEHRRSSCLQTAATRCVGRLMCPAGARWMLTSGGSHHKQCRAGARTWGRHARSAP